MKSYRLRTEFNKDATAIINYFHSKKIAENAKLIYKYVIFEDGNKSLIPDCEVSFDSNMELREIINQLNLIEQESNEKDGIELHVAKQTLNFEDDYTGERYYDIY